MVSETAFSLKDDTVENLRPLKVRVIGAGFSGILAAIRIPQRLRNIDLRVYEKEDGIGGVWWLNKYPGVACDVPSHSYQYTFAPNPNWSKLYAPGPEIQKYLQATAERFGATRFVQTGHRLEHAVWNDERKKWHLEVMQVATGTMLEEDCDVLVTARGQLNNMQWPALDGLERFRGTVMHSAAWDESCDLRGKQVVVLGNGSSAIQIVPQLQRVGGVQLAVVMRSRTWISPAFGDNAMRQLGLDPAVPTFPEELRATWEKDPKAYWSVRKVFEADGNSIHDSTVLGSDLQKAFTAACHSAMLERLAGRPDILEQIEPSFAPGCRRLTPGKGFLEALAEPNVRIVTDGITTITSDGLGLATTAGEDLPADVLVCATGFRVSAPPPFAVVGRGGRSLADRWASRPESYLSVAVDGFPNLFLLFGPNSAIGFGSLTKILEAECDYLVQVLRKLQREDYATIEPKAARVADFSDFIGAYFANTVYLDNCRSWYRTEGGSGNWICGLWPGSTVHALEALRAPRWEDFDYEPLNTAAARNRLRWLGNGRSETQKPGGDTSWYINPGEVDVPLDGKPEDDPRYQVRPWCY